MEKNYVFTKFVWNLWLINSTFIGSPCILFVFYVCDWTMKSGPDFNESCLHEKVLSHQWKPLE